MIKKPEILSDEEIAKAKNPILQESWVDFGQYVRGVTKEERAVAQAQNDYCYKEMLRQFIEWGDERVMCEHLAYYHRRKTCEGCWQALQSQLEEG